MSEPRIVKASISSKMLVSAYEKFRRENYTDEDGYPDVLNRQAFVDTLAKFCRKVARRRNVDGDPDQVRLNIVEDKSVHDGVRYVLVIEDEARLMGLPRTYALIMVYRPTNEAESVSTVSDEKITWSADNDTNTSHHHRTMYYVGFTSLIADKTPGFNKEPEPEHELNLTDFMAQAQGNLPSELVKIPGQEETQETEQEEKDYASEWHNGKSKEQENQEETESYNDIVTQFEDVESEFDY